MVHRHTEYKMKFYVPNEELSKKMWLENIKFRETRRAMNLADHYWDFQTTDEACVCEECGSSPHKSERKSPDNRKQQNSTKTAISVDKACKETSDVAISTFQEAGVQTPNWTRGPSRRLAELKNVPISRKGSQSLESLREVAGEHDKEIVPQRKQRSHRVSPSASGKSVYSLSKTTKNLHQIHDLQGPFFPFGWNDDNKNVGDMKTFNVLAPPREVHPPAIRAMKRRKEQVQKCVLSKEDKKQKSISLTSIPRINHSSIWVTEYKEKFSKNSMTAR